MKFTIWTILRVQFSSIKESHKVVQPSRLSIFRTLHQTETLYPLSNNPPFLSTHPHPQSLATSILLCLYERAYFRYFHVSGIIYCFSLCVWIVSFSMVFLKVLPCWSLYQYFIPVYGWMIFYFMNVVHFVYPFVHW